MDGKRLRLSDGAAALSLLPGLADNDWGYNARSYNQSLATFGTVQYATWVDDQRHPIIGKRTLPDGAWSTFDLTTLTGNISAVVDADSHNVFNVGVDADGYIHVSGNMHGDWLRYARSANPGDITTWTQPGMIRGTGSLSGTDEGLISYPRFLNHPDGTLLFHYRNGASVNGNNYLNAYDTATQTWSRVTTLVDGVSTAESGYENTPVLTADGVLHYASMWKSGSSFNDVNDVFYMRSADKGATWQDINGDPVALPVTHATGPTILDTAPSNSGLMNTSGMAVDALGRPHLALLYADDGNRNVFHLWWTGTAWRMDKVTSFTETALTFATAPARPAILAYGDRVFVIYRHQYEGKRGFVWMAEVTDGPVTADFPVARMDLRDWEPTFDPTALPERGELHMIVTRTNGDATSPNPGYGDADWTSQKIAVQTIDMALIDGLIGGTSALPMLPA